VRLVSRRPRKVNPGDQIFPANLTEPTETRAAVAGSEVVYLTVGLPYDTKVWERSWPTIMENVIEACKTHGAKLVFFDNVYMYDREHLGSMAEDTPLRPVSKKGVVRARLAERVLDAVAGGELQAIIARSADFYGPSIANTSILTEMVFKPFSNGKKANWLGSPTCRHSFTYTPDAAAATALLGNSAEAYNQVWHLPTAAEPPTGQEWIEAIAREMGVDPRYRVASKFLVRMMGLFVPIMREMVEMMYQYDRDYVFDSRKFEKRYDLKPTPYFEGIRSIVQSDYR
jgi:nucleoside-diphosphate-sugar epimerase